MKYSENYCSLPKYSKPLVLDMDANQNNKTYGAKSTFAQLFAVSGLCTLQIALGAGEMFCFVNAKPKEQDQNFLSCLFTAFTFLGCAQPTLLLARLGHRKCVALACVEYLVAGLGVVGLGGYAARAFCDDAKRVYVAGACAMAFADGASVGPCLAYVGETCEPWLRGSVCAAMIAIKYASYMAFVLAFGFGFQPALFPTAAVAVILIVTIAITEFKMPDSPMWLLTKGKHAKARRTLGRLRGNNSDVACAQEFQEIVKYTFGTTGHDVQNHALTDVSHTTDEIDEDVSSPWKQLLRPEVLRPFYRMISHLVIMNFLFKLHIFNRLEDIYENISKDKVGRDYVWWLYIPLCGYVATALLVNLLGKRTLSLFSLSVISVIYVMNSLLTVFQENINNADQECSFQSKNSDLVILLDNRIKLLNVLTMLVPSIGILPITNMLIAEIFPAKSRYLTCNICPALLIMTNFTLQKFYTDIMKVIINWESLFQYNECHDSLTLIFGIVGIIDCFYIYFYQKETENQSLREIYMILR